MPHVLSRYRARELGAAILPLERGHVSNVRNALRHVIGGRYGESAA